MNASIENIKRSKQMMFDMMDILTQAFKNI